ncbi:hypothetical protein JVU11DRAFT_7667 [Chiua virens]|nr:hypothetical protein JVU11DRAFT_7667 [Chiua virens]
MEEIKDRARQALDKFRFVCPIVACAIEDGESPRWVYTPSADREAWLDLAFVMSTSGDFLTLFISGSGMDVTIVRSEEWKNLPVDIITATGGVPKEWETSGAELLQDLTTQMNKTFMSGHSLAPPLRPLDMSQRQIRHNVTLSESETRAIVARATQLGVSLSVLFKAANGLAQLKLNPVPPGEDVCFPFHVTSVSPERYLKPSVNPKTYFASSISLMPLRVPLTESLRQGSGAAILMTAKKIQAQFDKYLPNPYLPVMMSILAQPPNSRTDQKATPDTSLVKLPWRCDFEHLGMIERRISTRQGHININDVCLGMRMGTVMSVRSWTMHRKLHFQVEGAAAWGDDILKKMLQETIRFGLLVVNDAKL